MCCRCRLAADDHRVRSTIAETLPTERGHRKQKAHEVEEEGIDKAKQVPHDRGYQRHVLAVFSYDPNANHPFPERHTRRRLADDVVAERERKHQQEAVAADIHTSVCITIAGLCVATAREETDEDDQWHEDDGEVEQNGDEAKCDTRVLELIPAAAIASAQLDSLRERTKRDSLLAQRARDPTRFGQRHADAAVEDVPEIDVIPAFDRRSDRPGLGVEAIDRDRPGGSIERHLDCAGRCIDDLPHSTAASSLSVSSIWAWYRRPITRVRASNLLTAGHVAFRPAISSPNAPTTHCCCATARRSRARRRRPVVVVKLSA